MFESTFEDPAKPAAPGDAGRPPVVGARRDPHEPARRQAASECFFSDACILAVDDEQSNLVLLDAMLSQGGYSKVVLTTDSSAVSALCMELSPDLILLDLHMPEPDGFELLEELSPMTSGGPYEPLVPIVIISADLTDEARARALSMGANDFIAKPFDAMETSLRVRNLLRMRRLYRDVTAHNRLLEQRLRDARATGGRERAATTRGQRSGDDEPRAPNADIVANAGQAVAPPARSSVLMDRQMPGIDGGEAARAIRSRDEAGRRTPIIAMSAAATRGDRCLGTGMDDHIAKPLVAGTLGGILRRWVIDEDGRHAPTGCDPSIPALDADRLGELRSLQRPGAPDVLTMLAGAFLEAAPAQVAALTAALAAHDADALRQAAHALKGSSANLGAQRLAALCAEFEELGRAGGSMPAGQAVRILQTELDRVRTAFRAELRQAPIGAEGMLP